MSDNSVTESPKSVGQFKRQNKSPLLQENVEETFSDRHKRLKTRENRAETAIMEKKLDDFISNSRERADNVNEKLDSLIEKHEKTDEKIDTLANDILNIKQKTATLETAQDNLRHDMEDMKIEMNRISLELGSVQQATLSHHFIMFGLPYDVPKENAFDVLANFAKKAGASVNKKDLKYIALKKNEKQKSSFLVGIFHDGRVRQQLFENAKKSRPITIEAIFPALPANSILRGKEISLREQIAPAIRKLLAEAHRMNNGRFKYIWARNGRILMKERDGDNEKTLSAQTIGQLVQIFLTFNNHRRTNTRDNSNQQSPSNMSTSSITN